MALTLEGCWAKVAGAHRHLKTVHDEAAQWTEGGAYAIAQEHDPEQQTYVFRISEIIGDINYLGPFFGDYVHNLRSALDNLAWALAVNERKGKEPRNRNEIAFPVTDGVRKFMDSPILRELAWEQVTVLESFQPYRRGGKDDPLALLDFFWNEDKHRLVPPVLARLDQGPSYKFGDLEIIDKWFEPNRPLEPGTKISCIRVRTIGAYPYVYVDRVPVQIAFGKGRRILLADLFKLLDVTEEILNACKKFFR